MIVLSAVLAAAIAASAPSAPQSPEPSAATTTAAPAAPAANAGEAQAALRAMLARELPALPARPFKTASGITGKVEAAAAPTVAVEAGGQVITVPLGTEAPLTCAIFPHRLDVGASIRSLVEDTKTKAKVVSALPVEVAEVGGKALVVFHVAYHLASAKGPLLGVSKLAAYTHPTHSLLCQHDEPGYGDTFARVVKGLAASLGGGAPDPRGGAIFAEIMAVRVGSLAVGYTEHLVSKLPGGGVVDEQFEAVLLPRGPDELVALDGSSAEAIDDEGLLVEGSFVRANNGELDVKVDLERGEDGKTYRYQGEKDGKKLEGSFTTKAGIATDRWFAPRFARTAPRPGGDVAHEGYSPRANPVAAVPVTYRPDAAAPRRVTVQQGPMTVTGSLDDHGFLETAELSVGSSKMVIQRIWSRGAP